MSITPFFIDRKLLGFLEKKESRNGEYRADIVGAKVSSPKAMLSVLENLEKSMKAQPKNFFLQLLDTHPDISYRIDAMDDIIKGNKNLS